MVNVKATRPVGSRRSPRTTAYLISGDDLKGYAASPVVVTVELLDASSVRFSEEVTVADLEYGPSTEPTSPLDENVPVWVQRTRVLPDVLCVKRFA